MVESVEQAAPNTPHEMAVTLEHGLRNLGFLQGGWAIEPQPDSEVEPNSFGISYQGNLVFLIQVEAW